MPDNVPLMRSECQIKRRNGGRKAFTNHLKPFMPRGFLFSVKYFKKYLDNWNMCFIFVVLLV
jgi:hypothetical protein